MIYFGSPLRHFPAVLVLCVLAASCGPAATKTRKEPVVNEYHGVKVVDDYQWLEQAGTPKVRQWSEAQNQRTRAWLDQLPERALIERRLQQLYSAVSANYSGLQWRNGQLFALKHKPPAQQAILVTLKSANDLKSEHVVLDPNQMTPPGATTIDFYLPSPDGKRVVVSLSEHGSEEGTLHLFDVATGTELSDVIPRVQCPTGGGSVAWNAEGSGLFYTRYPHVGERPAADLNFYQQVYFHQLGTPVEQDRYELGKELPRIAEITLQSSQDGRYLLASVANGDGGDFAHYLRGPAGQWQQITRFEDQIKQAEFGRDPLYIEWGKDAALYLLSRQGAPKGKILRLPLGQTALTNAQTMIKEGGTAIVAFEPAASGLYLVDIEGGPAQVRFYDFFEKKERKLAIKNPSAVQQLLVTHGDEVLFRSVTYTEPYVWNLYDPNKDKDRIEATALRGTSPTDFGDVEVVRVHAKSKDGTKVPLTIMRRKGTRLNGDNPAILTGYGGYGISLAPNFDFTRRVWMDQGGVIAIANLRGGGEFGEAWHQAGCLTNKQNVFDDFAACAQFLIRSNYTSPARLAIEGGSNGGLLMGATLTQHPELMQAVVSHVGIYDMLRVELDPNGAFNVTEFGTVKDPRQFRALSAYSPYHHVVDKTNYPAVLMLTGENDGRVNPAHSRKMTARLQAATGSPRPVLLRTSAGTGHGIGTALSERIAELADVYAFLCRQLGVDYTVIDRGPWCGAVTPTSAWIKAKLVQEGMAARLAVSQSPLLTRPIYSLPVRAETNAYNIVALAMDHLQPDTQYYYALEVDGRLDQAKRGAFRTFPEGPASFSLIWSGDARTGSTSDVFDRIREWRPLFFLNAGDWHYLDINVNSRPRFRAAYDTVLASPQQAELYRSTPFMYIWDDHDFGGNNCNRKTPSREAARLTYQEYMPHYPLGAGSGDVPIYQSFTVGRVKFILTDLRSERDEENKKDDAKKTMMGVRQKAWFKQELLEANGKYPLLCWVSSVPWNGVMRTNYYPIKTNQFGYLHHTNLLDSASKSARSKPPTDQEHWCAYATERRELADFIKSNHISGLCILHADSHMLAADDGSNTDFATGGGAPIPVMCAAPLDKEPSIKGGPYSQGIYRVREREGCFGLLTVTDRGTALEVAFSGLNNKNEEKVSLKFTVPAVKTVAKNP